MARRFKHLTMTDRLKIEAYVKVKKKVGEIAVLIGVSHSTISRELRRGRYTHMTDYKDEDRYSPDIAHNKYREHLKAKGAPLKIGNDHSLAEYIEQRIADDKYSPAAVLGEIKVKRLQFTTTICTSTLTERDVEAVERWMNRYPRRIFGYRSAEDMFNEQIAAIQVT